MSRCRRRSTTICRCEVERISVDAQNHVASVIRFDYIAIMTDALKKLLEAAKTANPTPEHREQQRRSFVYGNTHFENVLITREMVDREAEKLAKDKK
jgi:hypothetical protein